MKHLGLARIGSILVAALAFSSACAHQAGSFNTSTFHQGRYGYDVRYANPASLGVLSPDWALDNFYTAGATLQTRTDDIYTSDFVFDLDGDGRPDTTAKLPTYDLRFTHQRSPGVIWLRSIPVNAVEGPKDLRAVMQDYVDAASGVGCEVARMGSPTGNPRYAAQIIDQHPATVAGHEAYAATIDITDQMPMGPEPRHKRARLVLIRAALSHTESTVTYGNRTLPVFLLAGYANQAEAFDQNGAEFQTFLGQIVLRGYFGYAEQPGAPMGAGPGPGALPGPGFAPGGQPGAPAASAPGTPGAPPPSSMSSTAASAVGAEEAGKKAAPARKGKKR